MGMHWVLIRVDPEALTGEFGAPDSSDEYWRAVTEVEDWDIEFERRLGFENLAPEHPLNNDWVEILRSCVDAATPQLGRLLEATGDMNVYFTAPQVRSLRAELEAVEVERFDAGALPSRLAEYYRWLPENKDDLARRLNEWARLGGGLWASYM